MSDTAAARPVNAGPRAIKTIAADIRAEWSKAPKGVNFAAVPYLTAMESLETMDDRYGEDPAEGIVRYFLANAAQFKGAQARVLKEELRALLPKRQS